MKTWISDEEEKKEFIYFYYILGSEWKKKKLLLCSGNWREQRERKRGGNWRRRERHWRKKGNWWDMKHLILIHFLVVSHLYILKTGSSTLYCLILKHTDLFVSALNSFMDYQQCFRMRTSSLRPALTEGASMFRLCVPFTLSFLFTSRRSSKD